MVKKSKLGFVGAGNMGKALIEGLLGGADGRAVFDGLLTAVN